MNQTQGKRKPLFWLLPLLFALPLLGGMAYAWLRWGSTAADLLNVAVKLVVIP